jgi:hypothetical protein
VRHILGGCHALYLVFWGWYRFHRSKKWARSEKIALHSFLLFADALLSNFRLSHAMLDIPQYYHRRHVATALFSRQLHTSTIQPQSSTTMISLPSRAQILPLFPPAVIGHEYTSLKGNNEMILSISVN